MRKFIQEFFPLLLNLINLTAATCILASGIYFIQRLLGISWYVWLAVSPFLYFAWLVIYLWVASFGISRLARKYPKPRHGVLHADMRVTPETRALLTPLLSYTRFRFVQGLPLARFLISVSSLRGLYFRSYAASFHVGARTDIMGAMIDPDITEIGDDCVIGLGSQLTAHGATVRPNGDRVYFAAPIRIGNRVTIGGYALVRPGCVIGDDAIVAAGAVVEPFTIIGPGEVWSGNPARLERKRDGSGVQDQPAVRRPEDSRPLNSGTPRASSLAPAAPPAVPALSASLEEVRQMVVHALQLPPDTPAERLHASSLPEWDSLGKVAIASALLDRYGVQVSPDKLYPIRSLFDIAGLIGAGAASEGKASSEPVAPPASAPVPSAPAPRLAHETLARSNPPASEQRPTPAPILNQAPKRATQSSPAKAIVIDCDNILWGKRLAEAGRDGIQVAPDGAGWTFYRLQQALLDLKNRGILLAVASRNEEHDVRDAFASHPGMLLHAGHIAAWRANWKPVSENVQEIAAELNLPLDSVVFLTDDPASRLEIRMCLPGVQLAQLPADPAAYAEALNPFSFDPAAASGPSASHGSRTSPPDRHQYLASLNLHVEMRAAAPAELPRLAELTRRFRQFNLNPEKTPSAENPAWLLRAADRFGDYGIAGVCSVSIKPSVNEACVDTLAINARLTGRGIEEAFLYGIAEAALQHGASLLVATCARGERNGMVLDFLRACGFAEAEPGRWELSLAHLPALPSHVKFTSEDSQRASAQAV